MKDTFSVLNKYGNLIRFFTTYRTTPYVYYYSAGVRVALLLAPVASLCASLALDGRDRGAEGGGARPRGGPLCSAMHGAPLRRRPS